MRSEIENALRTCTTGFGLIAQSMSRIDHRICLLTVQAGRSSLPRMRIQRAIAHKLASINTRTCRTIGLNVPHAHTIILNIENSHSLQTCQSVGSQCFAMPLTSRRRRNCVAWHLCQFYVCNCCCFRS